MDIIQKIQVKFRNFRNSDNKSQRLNGQDMPQNDAVDWSGKDTRAAVSEHGHHNSEPPTLLTPGGGQWQLPHKPVYKWEHNLQ